MSVLSRPYFHDEEKAFAHLEGIVLQSGPVCPHCGGVDRIVKIKANPEKRVRYGLHRCNDCKKQFTVKVGSVFEHMRIPLHKALQAVYLMRASKKGISAHQLHRILEVQYKTAWFLCHCIREAMRFGDLSPMGGPGKVVEADKTYFGRLEGVEKPKTSGLGHKNTMLTLVKRGGPARPFHVSSATVGQIVPILRANIAKETSLKTDESRVYVNVGDEFDYHGTTNHTARQYVRGDDHTNTVEGFYSIFKRGMKGVYQHCAEHHLHRYLAEFDFRYSTRVALNVDDAERTNRALEGISGKRLTYRQPYTSA